MQESDRQEPHRAQGSGFSQIQLQAMLQFSTLPAGPRGLGLGTLVASCLQKSPIPTQRQVPTPEQEERGRLSKGGLRGNRDTPLQEPLSQVWEEGEAGPSRSHCLHHTPLLQAETSCRVAASAWRR